MAKKRAAKTEAEQPAPESTPPPPQEGMSKADAVRAALAEGVSQPEEAVAFIKGQFGIDITRQMFSSYKAAEKIRQKKKVGRPRGRKPASAGASVAGGAGDVVQALATIKGLVDAFGVEQVVRIAEVFRK